MALRNLLVRVGADISGLNNGMNRANKRVSKFSDDITKKMGGIKGVIAGAVAGIGSGLIVTSGVQDAIKFEALMGTLGESLGKSMDQFVKWQDTVAGTMGFSRLQSVELANMLSLNLKKIATDTEDLTKKTIQLMEMAAVAANKRGMSQGEVSDRIRSAMNSEADGADELGVNVRVAAIETSKAYRDMGVSGPWDKLSENIRKTILYHHLLEEVAANLGTTIQDNTALKMSVFTASLRDLRMALGSAFIPILNVVLPILTAFAQKLYRAMQYVYAFTKALFGYKGTVGGGIQTTIDSTKATEKQATSIGGLGDAVKSAGKKTKQAGKDAKRGLAGFDEINELSEPSTDSGGGGDTGGGGGGVDIGEDLGFPDEDPFPIEKPNAFDVFGDSISNAGRKIREFFKESVGFEAFTEGLHIFWNSLKDFWNSDAIKAFRQNFKEDLPDFFDDLMLIGGGAFEYIGGSIETLNGLINGDFDKTISGMGTSFSGVYKMFSGTVGLIFPDLGNKLDQFGEKFGKKWKWFYDTFVKDSHSIREVLDKIWNAVVVWFKLKVDEMKEYFKKKVAEMTKDSLGKFETWKNDMTFILNVLKGTWKNLGGKSIDEYLESFKKAPKWMQDNVINPIKKGFKGISDAFDVSVANGFKYVYNKAVGWLNTMISDINGIKIPGVWSGVNIKKIPALAKGGITSGPTLALVGDNVGGKEVISPLDKLQSIVTSAVMAAMKFNGNNQSNVGGDIVLNLDGRTFARIVRPHLVKENKRIGANVKLNPI